MEVQNSKSGLNAGNEVEDDEVSDKNVGVPLEISNDCESSTAEACETAVMDTRTGESRTEENSESWLNDCNSTESISDSVLDGSQSNEAQQRTEDSSAEVKCLKNRVTELEARCEALEKQLHLQSQQIATIFQQLQPSSKQDSVAKHQSETNNKDSPERNTSDWLDTEAGTISNIAQEITNAANKALEEMPKPSGMVYEEQSGLYYDYDSGYYYDSEKRMYYDGSKGMYLYYDDSSNSYKYYEDSVVNQKFPSLIRKENSSCAKDSDNNSENLKESLTMDVEESEMTETSSEEDAKSKSETQGTDGNEMEEIKRHVKRAKVSEVPYVDGDEFDVSEHEMTEEGRKSEEDEDMEGWEIETQHQKRGSSWPPCIRVIVEQSDQMKRGSLFIVTHDGAKIGKHPNNHIVIPSEDVSKFHASIHFGDKSYWVQDEGSRNGTWLDGTRVTSSATQVHHGSALRLAGNCVLTCHIHPGMETCNGCEPGVVMAREGSSTDPATVVSREEQRREEMKSIKRKYGLNKKAAPMPSGYRDRAQVRRIEKGSDNPHAKTEVASLDTSISSKNKGFQMLSKMGWKEGSGLGKSEAGNTEPVPLTGQGSRAGLGSDPLEVEQPELTKKEKNKKQVWEKTRDRFNKLQ